MEDLVKRAKARAADLDYEASERDRNDPTKSELRGDAQLMKDLAERVDHLERAHQAIIVSRPVNPLWEKSTLAAISRAALRGEPWE